MIKHHVSSVKGGITTIDEGMVLLLRAKELGIPFSTAIEHIHIINGKTGVDVHIVNALLSRAGIEHTWVRQYMPLYEYTDGSSAYVENRIPDCYVKCANRDAAAELVNRGEMAVYPVKWYADLNGGIYKDYQLNAVPKGTFTVVPNAGAATANMVAKVPGVPIFRCPNQPIDFISEVKLARMIKFGNGEKLKEATYSYTFSEAANAELTTKDVWRKYPQDMLQHRALVRGARDFAPDVLNGMLSQEELSNIIMDTSIYDAEDATVID
jgi:hypothetical protein